MPHQSPLSASCESGANTTGRLLTAVTQIADTQSELAVRRTELLKLLIELTGAAAGTWDWGVADDSAQSILLVATVEHGFSAEERTAILKMGLDPSMLEEFRMPVMKKMQERATRLGTTLRTELYDDEAWKKTQMYANLSAGQFDEWIHSVRYSNSETWSSLFLVRRCGAEPFHAGDQQLINLAMGNIPWLWATLDNTMPAEACSELTSRQRIVLAMRLDGLPRKEIAKRLEIGVDTVGDHIKKIHEHFGVGSVGELAAVFLRNR